MSMDGETVETVSDFILRGSKITVDGDCSHEIKRRLLLGRKAMTNLKCRDTTLPTKVRLVKAMLFPGVMCGCESWTIRKAECQRIDAFKLVLEKTLESPSDCKELQPVNPKGNQHRIFIERTDAKAPILWCSAFLMVQLSHPYMTTGKTIALLRWTFVSSVCLCFLICCLGWS